MGKSPHIPEWKIEVVKEYLSCQGSYKQLAASYGIGSAAVQKYRMLGEICFAERSGNAHYSKHFKTMCVEAVLSGEGSVNDVVAKYNTSAREVLWGWIKRYNANMRLKGYDPKREVYMADARRKTTLEERKKIREYCIAHSKNYKGTSLLTCTVSKP